MAEPLKNQFDRNLVELLAARFAAADTDFAPEAFITALLWTICLQMAPPK